MKKHLILALQAVLIFVALPNVTCAATSVGSEDCAINPETRYQNLMKKESLTPPEQAEVLKLEKQLSKLIFLSTCDPPICLKNKSWKIDLKAVEERMKAYRHSSDGFEWIDWKTYSNPKIQKDGAAYIIQTFAEFLGEEGFPMPIRVPGQENCDGCDGPSKSEKELSDRIQESCAKHTDKFIRQNLRMRVIEIMKQMDSLSIRADGDADPTPAQKKKILSERKRIRKNLTDILNTNCS